MQYFSPDASDLAGSDSSQVPTGMANDPNADEEVINQDANQQYPKPVEEADDQASKIAPDDLAGSIAYALDGSGPGPTNDQPNVLDHKVITEGTTGAGPDEEEENLRS